MKQFNGTDYDTLYPKTVYNQVSGVAPAGYGLGETSPYIAKTSESGEYDADTIDKTGFFAARTNTPTRNWCYGLHVNRTNNLAFQLVTSEFSEKEFALRKKIDGVWQPWEWVNPPMKLGVEYRTTERWSGRPVYKKNIDFGTLPTGTTKAVSIGAENIRDVAIDLSLSYCRSDYGQNVLPITSYITGVEVVSGSIKLTTNSAAPSKICIICVKYTKTTD